MWRGVCVSVFTCGGVGGGCVVKNIRVEGGIFGGEEFVEDLCGGVWHVWWWGVCVEGDVDMLWCVWWRVCFEGWWCADRGMCSGRGECL